MKYGPMLLGDEYFQLRLADSAADVAAALALRYRVFVRELGADGPLVDHARGLERDRFDDFADHLLLFDSRRDGAPQLVATTRLMRAEQARAAGQFYSEYEYDLAPLRRSGQHLLEIGRTCLAPEFRGGAAMLRLWSGLAGYVAAHDIDLLFGVASFPGTDIAALAAPLSFLHHRHLAPAKLRPVAREKGFQRMDLMGEAHLDRMAASRAIPPLIKSYLRLGGQVGDGAWVDPQFNCTDICLILDTAALSPQGHALYRSAPQG